MARPHVRRGGVQYPAAHPATAILRPTFRPLYRRLSASCVQWAVAPVGPRRVFVFRVFRPQSPGPKKFLDCPFPNTTKAQTQMEAPLVGVQGHQKQLENTKPLMEIDVFVCLVVQEPGAPGGHRLPGPP